MNELINLGNGAMVKVTMLKGEAGSSISNIAKTSIEGLVDTYTITLTDGSTKTFTVTNGKSIVSIDKTNTTGLVDTYTITFNDNTTINFSITNGKGISSINKTTTVGLVDTYTITFNDGTTTSFDITNGADGADGVGISSIAKTDTTGLVDTYTITYTNGQTTTFTVTNGANGSDVSQSNLAPVETGNTASQSYAVGSHLIWNGIYYVVTQAIAVDETLNIGVNIQQDTVSNEIEQLQESTHIIEDSVQEIGTYNGKKMFRRIRRKWFNEGAFSTATSFLSGTLISNYYDGNSRYYRLIDVTVKYIYSPNTITDTNRRNYPDDFPATLPFSGYSDFSKGSASIAFVSGGGLAISVSLTPNSSHSQSFILLYDITYMEA